MKYQQRQQGYSLIELIIYLAIFIVLSVILINSLVSAMRTYATAESYRVLQNNGELIMERLTREVRDADSISTGTVYEINPGELVLSRTDTDLSVHAVTVDVENGTVIIDDNGTSGPLSTSEVTISSLVFHHITTSVSEGVRIELTLATAKGYSNSASFYTTVLLR
jgi:type II secretory pathway pseudopilin PulG